MPGLVFDGRLLSGTPVEGSAGLHGIALQATGALGQSLRAQFRLTVRPRLVPLAIPAQDFAPVTAGMPFVQSLGGIGGEGRLDWTAQADAIPDLRVLCPNSPAACVIRGTAPTAGPVAVELSVMDASGAEIRATRSLPILPPPAPALALCEAAVIPAVIETYLSHRICVRGGYPPYRVAIDWDPDVPPWVELDADAGVLTGRVDSAGRWTATVVVTDSRDQTASSGAITLRAARRVAGEVKVLPADLSVAQVGRPFRARLAVDGARDWRIAGVGQVPEGLTVSIDGRSATISGTPQVEGTFPLAVTLETDAERALPDTRGVERQLRVGPSAPAMRLGPQVLPVLGAGQTAAIEFYISGGVPPISLRPDTAEVPEGMVWDCADRRPVCTLRGTPLAPGTHRLVLAATDAADATLEDERTLTVTGDPAATAPQILPDTLPVAISGEPYSAILVVTGLDPALALSPEISGPDWLGLAVDGPVMTLSGTPPSPGRATVALSDPQFEALLGRPSYNWVLRVVVARPDDPCAGLDLPVAEQVPDLGSRDGARAVQQALAAAGFYSARVDGLWGAGSERALSDFRARNGLPQGDGIDACTFHYLNQR